MVERRRNISEMKSRGACVQVEKENVHRIENMMLLICAGSTGIAWRV